MSFEKIQELRAKRAKLVKEAREILDREDKENRSLTQEEIDKYERIMSDVDKLGEQIEREERLAGVEGIFDNNEPKGKQDPAADEPDKRTRPRATEEYRQAFWNVLRSPRGMADPQEIRDLFKSDDSKGGYLAPEEFEQQLLRELGKTSVMRQIASVVQSSTDRRIPMVTEKPSFSYIAEKGEYGKTSMSFDVIHISAYKAGGIILVSEELMQDSYFDIEAEIRRQFVEAQSELEENSFINGDGNEKPTGVLVDAQKGVDTAASGITADDLMDLFYSLKRGYRQRGTWLMHDSTIKSIRKLKNNDGQFIWQPGLQSGEPDRILGRPVVTSDFMPAIEASAKSIAFGDFSRYRIMDRLGISIQRLDELYAETGQVGFRCTFRNDGKLLLPEAVKYIQHAAS